MEKIERQLKLNSLETAPKRNNFIRYWLPVLLWMTLIFFLSHQDKDESRKTSELVLWVLNFLHIDIETLKQSSALLVIRKMAHMTEYAILAILSARAFGLDFRMPKLGVIVFSFCVAYAATDEFHQTFVYGRTGTVVDVGIDSIGVLIGIGIFYLFTRSKSEPLSVNSQT